MTDTLRMASSLIPLFAVPLLVGMPITSFNQPGATAWWVGVCGTGLFLLIGHALNIPFPVLFLGIGLGCLGSLIMLAKKFRTYPVSLLFKNHTRNFVFLNLLVFLTAIYAVILSRPLDPLYQDAFSLWFNKAKGLFYGIPLTRLPFPGFAMANYPHLGPIYEMFMMKFAGAPIEPIARLIFPTFYILWIGALAQLPIFKSAEGILWFLPAVAIIFFDQAAYTQGYQDGFLAATAGMAALHFTLVFQKARIPITAQNHFRLATFFSGVLCFIKVEGMVMALILIVVFCAIFLISGLGKNAAAGVRFLFPFLSVFAVMMACWPTLLLINHLDTTKISGPAYTYRDIFHFYQNFGRWPVISRYFLAYFQSHLAFILSSVSLSATAAYFFPKVRKSLLFLWLVWAAHILFVTTAFLATTLPLVWHLQTAFDRLMFQHFFIYVTIIAETGAILIAHLIDFLPPLSPTVRVRS